MTALVLGGGPAGSLAATLLARDGARVTLIEQHRFPRDKVCGECLSDLGRRVLRRHGLEASLAGAGRSIDAAVLVGRGGSTRLALPRPMLGVSRAAMDAALLNAAVDAGVRVLQPARAEAVGGGTNGVRVRVRDLMTNTLTHETADWCLVADGRGTLNPQRPAASGDLGIKAHFTDVTADPAAVTLYGGFGCYGGVAPIEGGRWNVAFSVPSAMAAAVRGDLRSMWVTWLSSSPTMRTHFAGAQQASDWLACPLPRHAPPSTIAGRVVPIGAAAGAIEPIGGEGMGTALRSAELAAKAILADDTSTLPGAYAALWRRRSLFCRLGGIVLSDATASDAAALAATPVVARAAMWLVGK